MTLHYFEEKSIFLSKCLFIFLLQYAVCAKILCVTWALVKISRKCEIQAKIGSKAYFLLLHTRPNYSGAQVVEKVTNYLVTRILET